MKIISFITDQQVSRQIPETPRSLDASAFQRPAKHKFRPLKTMSRFMNSSMTCLHSTYRLTIALATMNPVLRKIKPFLYSSTGRRDGLAIFCQFLQKNRVMRCTLPILL